MLDDPLYIALEIFKTPKAQEEMLRLFQELLRNNRLSIVLREISTDRVVGICLNTIEVGFQGAGFWWILKII